MTEFIDPRTLQTKRPRTRRDTTILAKNKVARWAFVTEVLGRFVTRQRRPPSPRGKDNLKTKPRRGLVNVAFFGHFNGSNFGNEATFYAILYHLRRSHPDAQVTCICSGPRSTAATYHIDAIPYEKSTFAVSWGPRNRLLWLVRRVLLVVSEPTQWAHALRHIRRKHMLIVPGTGLLNDATGVYGWGPHNLFRWCLLAKLCRCKVLLVSVGAGPLYGLRGRWLVKSILRLADFRSYRDESTFDYLTNLGFHVAGDPIYPDLAYSLPHALLPRPEIRNHCRSVVGLGVMEYAGKYSVNNPTNATYHAYLDHFSTFAKWLLERKYDVKLLSGDLRDDRSRKELKDLLRSRTATHEYERIIDESPESIDSLFSHIAETDIVIATRFHNILLALLSNKPVIAISFHHKCRSLMRSVGLEKYCLDINDFSADSLIETFVDLRKNADDVIAQSSEKARQFCDALDEQYQTIFRDMWPVD